MGTQESCKMPPALSTGAQSPIPFRVPRSSVAQSCIIPHLITFPMVQKSLSLARGPELSPQFMGSSCHLVPEC